MTRAKRLRLIARAELRRRWRTMKGNTTQLLALAFAGIMLLPFSIGGVFGAYLAGGFVAGSETEPLIEWARWRSSTGGYSWSDSVDTARTPWRSVPTTSTAC